MMNTAVASVRITWSRIMRRLNEAMAARARVMDGQGEQLEEPPAPPRPRLEPPLRPGGRPPQLTPMDRFRVLWWRYHYPAVAFSTGMGLAVLFGLCVAKPSYKASATIAVEAGGQTWDQMVQEGRAADLLEQLQSRAVLEPVLRELGMFPLPLSKARTWLKPGQQDPEDPRALQRLLSDFRRRLEVERLRRSNMLHILVRADDPHKAAMAANAVARAFIGYHRGEAIADVERKITALDQEIAGIQSELDMLTLLRSEVLVDDTLLNELVRQLAAADTRLSQVRSRYKEVSPTVQQARREKESLESILRGRILERRMQLQERLEHREQPAASFQQPAAVTLDAAIEQTTQRYRELLNQRAETHLSLTLWQQPSDSFDRFSILDAALPPPAKSRIVTFVVGLLAAALAVCLSLVLVPLALHEWETRTRRPGSFAQRLRRWTDREARDFSAEPTP